MHVMTAAAREIERDEGASDTIPGQGFLLRMEEPGRPHPGSGIALVSATAQFFAPLAPGSPALGSRGGDRASPGKAVRHQVGGRTIVG